LPSEEGLVAERLGTGLQNRLQRFESARDLENTPVNHRGLFFCKMLVGEDFNKIHITMFGLNISEPNVMLSDLFMSIISFYCGLRLLRGSGYSSFKSWWVYFFFVYGFSALSGGIGHALYAYFGSSGKLCGWISGIFSIYLIERAMTEAFNDLTLKYQLKKLSLIKLIFFLIVFFSIFFFRHVDKQTSLPFLPIAINTIIGVTWFAGYYSFKLSKQINSDFRYIYVGVLIMIPSAFFFLCKVNIHPWLDKNDISHFLLTLGIVCFFIGVEKISLTKEKIKTIESYDS
jgi:hypothetical protein